MPATRAEVLARRRQSAVAVGRRLAEVRERAGLSQAEVAARLGVAQSAIAKLELGQRTLEFAVALQLARVCGVPVEALDPSRPLSV